MAYPDANPLRNIFIHRTVMASDTSGTFAQYCVQVELIGREWEIRRRYRQFLALDDALRCNYGSIMERMPFPPKVVFSVSRSATRSRCRELQQYLIRVASISVPVVVGSQTMLVRMRELDDFLEVAQHLHAPVDLSNPLFSRPAGGLASVTAEGAAEQSTFHSPSITPLVANKAGRRLQLQKQIRELAQMEIRLVHAIYTARSNDGLAVAAAKEAVKQGRNAYEAAVVAVVSHAIDVKFLSPGSVTREARTVQAFIRKHEIEPSQEPQATLSAVCEFVEDFSGWIAHYEAEELSIVLQDARAAGSAAAARAGQPGTGDAMAATEMGSGAATAGRGPQRVLAGHRSVLNLDDVDNDPPPRLPADAEPINSLPGPLEASAPAAGEASRAGGSLPSTSAAAAGGLGTRETSGLEVLEAAGTGVGAGTGRSGSGIQALEQGGGEDDDGASISVAAGAGRGGPRGLATPQRRGFRQHSRTDRSSVSARLTPTGLEALASPDGTPATPEMTRMKPTPTLPGDTERKGPVPGSPSGRAVGAGAVSEGCRDDDDGDCSDDGDSIDDGRHGDGSCDEGDGESAPWLLHDDEVDSDTRLLRRAARMSLERAVVLPLAPDLLYRSQQLVGGRDAVFCSKLAVLQAALGSLRPDQFGVEPSMLPVLRSPFVDEACAHLLAMEQMPTPSLMAGRLLLAVRAVYASLASTAAPPHAAASAATNGLSSPHGEDLTSADSANSTAPEAVAAAAAAAVGTLPNPSSAGSVGADDFLPLFIWCVARSGVSRPATCESFIRSLMTPVDLRGELAYYCTTLESAIYYVCDLEVVLPESATADSDSPFPISAVSAAASAAASPGTAEGGARRSWFSNRRATGTGGAPGARHSTSAGSPLHPAARGASDADAISAVHGPGERPGAPPRRLAKPFPAVHVVDGALAASVGESPRERRMSMSAAASAAAAGGEAVHVPAAALSHAAFRLVDACTAGRFLAGAAWERVMRHAESSGRQLPSGLSGGAGPLSRQDMVETGPSAGWLWVLHPVAPALPDAVLGAALERVPCSIEAAARHPQGRLLALSFIPLPPRPVAGCCASLQPADRLGAVPARSALQAETNTGPRARDRRVSTGTAPRGRAGSRRGSAEATSAAITAAAGGDWASLFEHGSAAGLASPSASGSGGQQSPVPGAAPRTGESAADSMWAGAVEVPGGAKSLELLVRRVFVLQQSPSRWYFLPPRGVETAAEADASRAAAAASLSASAVDSWPPLSSDARAWNWSGPFPSLKACVVWSQTTYEGVGSADLKRLAEARLAQPRAGSARPGLQ